MRPESAILIGKTACFLCKVTCVFVLVYWKTNFLDIFCFRFQVVLLVRSSSYVPSQRNLVKPVQYHLAFQCLDSDVQNLLLLRRFCHKMEKCTSSREVVWRSKVLSPFSLTTGLFVV